MENQSQPRLNQLLAFFRRGRTQEQLNDPDYSLFKSHRRWLICAVVTLLVVVTIWLLVMPFFGSYKIGNVTVPITATDTALRSAIVKASNSYKLTVQYPDGKRASFALSNLGIQANVSATAASLRAKQHGFLQRLIWWRPITVPVVVNTTPNKLHDFIAKNITVVVRPSQDASLTINNGQIQVTDASAGKEYGLSNPAYDLVVAASRLQTQPIIIKTLTVTPALTAQQLAGSKAELEKLLNQPASFTIGTRTITATPGDIANWLELTPDDKAKKLDIAVNSGKVSEYINKITAADIHPARDQIVITQSDGSSSVLIPGVNGQDVTNKQVVATNVANAVLKGSGVQASLAISYAPYKTISTSSYPKWIEVDLTNKRMYAYEQTNQVNSFLITAGAPATPTVTGQYNIYAKYTQQDMRGQNADGSHYYQPNVPWINYFYRDYAIHGNYWRPLSYFGNINSSHGCVSVVPSEAEWIYNWAPIGTPVIVHT